MPDPVDPLVPSFASAHEADDPDERLEPDHIAAFRRTLPPGAPLPPEYAQLAERFRRPPPGVELPILTDVLENPPPRLR